MQSDDRLSSRRQGRIATSDRAFLTTAVFYLAWLQPLMIHRLGIPLASVAIGLTAILVVVDRLRQGLEIPFIRRPALFGYLGLVWAVIAAFGDSDWRNLLVWTTLALALLAGPCLALSSPDRTRRSILCATSLGMLTATLAVLVQQLVSPNLFGLITEAQNPLRSAALAPNPNAGAVYLMVGIVLTIALRSPRDGAVTNRSTLLLAAGGAWALLQTGSRGALLGAAVGLLFVVAVRRANGGASIAIRLGAVGALGIAAWGLIGFLPTSLSNYFSTRARLEASGDRTSIWEAAVDIVSANPVFGASEFSAQGFSVNNAHNTILETAIRYGLPGAAIFLAIVASFVALYLRAGIVKDVALAGTALLVAATTYSLTHTGMLDNTFIWVTLGALAFAGTTADSQEQPATSMSTDRTSEDGALATTPHLRPRSAHLLV